jgi:hypothetical protein
VLQDQDVDCFTASSCDRAAFAVVSRPHQDSLPSSVWQVLYTVYDSAMLQPLLDTVNEEKAKAAAEEA